MHIIRSFVIAFSLYSKIPVPQFEWKEEDMKYVLCFFPWIGAVIGAGVYLWYFLWERAGWGEMAYVLIGTAIPLMITGGFHADGFMDTMDAFHSYRSREKKMEILKDPHIGAFAVLSFALYGLVYMGAFSEIRDKSLLSMVCGAYFLSRCLSGISVVTFPRARKEGMLSQVADHAQKKAVLWSLYLQTLGCIAYMLWQSLYAGMITVATALVIFLYYYCRTKKEFGGITGDTAGYFVLICEAGMLLVTAVFPVLI